MNVLTVGHLCDLGACSIGVAKFEELFGTKMKVNITNAKKLAAWGTTADTQLAPVAFADWGFLDWYACESRAATRRQWGSLLRLHQAVTNEKITLRQYVHDASKIFLAILKKEKA